MSDQRQGNLSRRDFLQTGAAALGAASLASAAFGAEGKASDPITIGIFTDAHYADAKARGTRHYRDSEAKVGAFVEAMGKAKPDFVIELGDFVDSGPDFATEMGFLKHIEKVYRGLACPRYHVIGNHDLSRFSKKQFMDVAGMTAPHYSFDSGPFHFVVLDANFNKDMSPYGPGMVDWKQTYIPPAQQKWLEAELAGTAKKVLVFVHQRLDDVKDPHGIKNGPEVRKILEASGKVLAVFQGHDHRGNYRRINDIHYLTHRAVVEGAGLANNSFALVTVSAGEDITLQGFGKQKVPAELKSAPRG
ncbi:MAG: metallophosphoesterase [Phycisphaerae bacterium]|nr:metallophosphoesterase [Phycisphaerae bacterium]